MPLPNGLGLQSQRQTQTRNGLATQLRQTIRTPSVSSSGSSPAAATSKTGPKLFTPARHQLLRATPGKKAAPAAAPLITTDSYRAAAPHFLSNINDKGSPKQLTARLSRHIKAGKASHGDVIDAIVECAAAQASVPDFIELDKQKRQAERDAAASVGLRNDEGNSSMEVEAQSLPSSPPESACSPTSTLSTSSDYSDRGDSDYDAKNDGGDVAIAQMNVDGEESHAQTDETPVEEAEVKSEADSDDMSSVKENVDPEASEGVDEDVDKHDDDKNMDEEGDDSADWTDTDSEDEKDGCGDQQISAVENEFDHAGLEQNHSALPADGEPRNVSCNNPDAVSVPAKPSPSPQPTATAAQPVASPPVTPPHRIRTYVPITDHRAGNGNQGDVGVVNGNNGAAPAPAPAPVIIMIPSSVHSKAPLSADWQLTADATLVIAEVPQHADGRYIAARFRGQGNVRRVYDTGNGGLPAEAGSAAAAAAALRAASDEPQSPRRLFI